MVKLLDAVVAHGAVRASGWSVEATRGTPFHAHLNAPHLHRLIERSPEIILFIFIVLGSWEDAWVHKRSHAKVGQGEEEDHDVVDRNERRETLGQPRTSEAQEQCRGPNEEGCRRRYGHVATGTKAAGRGGVSESPTHTETRRHRDKTQSLKRIGGVRKRAFDDCLSCYRRKVRSS